MRKLAAVALMFMLAGCITVRHVVTVEFVRPEWLPEKQPTTQPADDDSWKLEEFIPFGDRP